MIDELRAAWLDVIAVFTVTLAVYLLTLCPTVYVGDSGELITAAATLGLAHPPGYPLYILVGRIFMIPLFFLPPALAMNLFSALSASTACVLMYLLIRRGTGRREVALVSAALLGFSDAFWSQATIARVYCLNAFFILLALNHMHLWFLKPSRSRLCWFFFVCGLGLANHTAMLILLGAAVAVMLVADRRQFGPNRVCYYAVSLLPGLALYLYIPISSAFEPYQNWGDPSSSLTSLWQYLTRASYWEKAYVESLGDAVWVAGHYLSAIPHELTWVGAALVPLGIVYGWEKQRALVATCILMFLINVGLMILHGSRSDITYWPRYLIPGWTGLIIIAALGMAKLLNWIVVRRLHLSWMGWVAAGLLPAICLASNYRANDRSRNTLARDYNFDLLNKLPDAATLIAEGDNVLFPLIYLHHVEGLRPDVRLILQGVNVLADLPIGKAEKPIFFTHHHNLGTNALQLLPSGLTYRLVLRDQPVIPESDWGSYRLSGFDHNAMALDYLSRNLLGHFHFMRAINLERVDLARSLAAVEDLRRIDYNNAVAHHNAGLLYLRNCRLKEASEALSEALKINPREGKAVNLLHKVQTRLENLPDFENKVQNKAVELFRSGDSKASLAELSRAVAKEPCSYPLQHSLAALYIKEQRYLDARRALMRALVIRPAGPEALNDLRNLDRLLSRPPSERAGAVEPQ